MNRIRALRQQRGWRQEDLARALNLRDNSISRYELEQRQLDPTTIHALCDLFNVSADYLLGRTNTPQPSVTEEDAQLLRAYHAAPENVRSAIDALLLPPVVAQEKKDA